MASPEVPIAVDSETGVWSTDGLPMMYVPRHFFINNHLAVEQALGREAYARILYEAGYKSAQTWCEAEAGTHGLRGVEVFHHYMKRISQRGWGRFTTVRIDPGRFTAEVRVEHSCFVLGATEEPGGKRCYMYQGWLPGALAWVAAQEGSREGQSTAVPDPPPLNCVEVRCAGEGGGDHCLFQVAPVP